ncbi:glycosyltransferase family 2 protein [Candidatus Woesearchaeota archaeon]|nr:glycosyltransferase family 2 protein [Candidatus Woesearchaeota archaeon]
MANLMLVFSGILFGSLLLFLLFVFSVFIVGLFRREPEVSFSAPVSVVIPAYNEEANIKRCIRSVLASDYPAGFEVIVVDDDSSDRTVEIARELARRDRRVSVVQERHGGKSAALNAGIRRARNEFVFTLDADTIVEKDCIAELMRPFADSKVAAASANCRVLNSAGVLGWFQNIEYHYNNLISSSFSRVFGQSMWFFGAAACYRKPVLEKIGFFKREMLAEDMNVSLEVIKAGFKSVNVRKAVGWTSVPESVPELFRQRYVWCIGGLQAVLRNFRLLGRSVPVFFLGFTQFWGTLYSLLAIPVIAYLVFYWLPYNSGSLFSVLLYLFRWFSIVGTFFVIYKIPEWGIAYYTLFGILSGIVSMVMIVSALRMFNDRMWLRNAAAVFFYFPYTILLNLIIVASIVRHVARVK